MGGGEAKKEGGRKRERKNKKWTERDRERVSLIMCVRVCVINK